MTVSRVSRTALLFVWLAVSGAAAQEDDRAATAPPRPLQQQPGDVAPEVSPGEADSPPASSNVPQGSESPAASSRTYLPAQPSVLGQSDVWGVEVGTLGAVDGPPVGLLDDTTGGLGFEMWAGTPREWVEDVLPNLPVATTSRSVRALARRLLLTESAPPSGPARRSLLAIRLSLLLDAGLVEDAAALAAKIEVRDDFEIGQKAADALLYAGREAELCGAATGARMKSAEQFWIELRALCYALGKNVAGYELTRAVMEARGIEDPAFDALMQGVTGKKAGDPGAIEAPTAIHVFLMRRAGMTVTDEIAGQLGVPASMLVATDDANPPEDRLAAARRLLRSGAIAPEMLAAVLDAQSFTPDQVAAAREAAAGMDFLSAQALFRQALANETREDVRAELVYAALARGDAEGLLDLAAHLHERAAAAIVPADDWDSRAALMGRSLLLTGHPEAAVLWYDILDFNAPDMAPAINQFQLHLALAAPNEVRLWQSQSALNWLAKEGESPSPVGGGDTLRRAVLELGMFDALGRQMPPEARVRALTLQGRPAPGRRPAQLLLDRMLTAAAQNRRGEFVLAALAAVGNSGFADLAPDVAVRIVRGLQAVAISDAAEAIGIEAALTSRLGPGS